MKTQLQKLVLISAILSGMTSCLEQGSTPDAAATTQKASGAIVAQAVAPPVFVIPTDPVCTFNGAVVPAGASVSAFQNSTVGFGNICISETRTCSAGALSGSYQFASCTVGAPADCLFNGVTVTHGTAVTGYMSSTVPFGQVCSSVAETRTCNNGVLSGSATFASCNISAAQSCLFDGKTILSGNSVVAFQTSTSQFGGSCTQESRTCTDGTLSGSFAFGSCTIAQPASCLFNGRTLAHGEIAVAFQSSTSAFGVACIQENRTCNNGVLSGSFNFDSCSVNLPASCSFNGTTVTHGTSIVAFQAASVAFGSSCISEPRSCSNGILSGSFTNSLCQVQAAPPPPVIPPTPPTPTVGTNPPPSCTFNGVVYPSDATVTAYQTATVPFGQACVSESRQCLSGAFTGSFTNASCSVSAAANCTLNGKIISSGSSVTVFTTSSVAAGQVCQSEVRSCSNGILSGSAVSEVCVILAPVVVPPVVVPPIVTPPVVVPPIVAPVTPGTGGNNGSGSNGGGSSGNNGGSGGSNTNSGSCQQSAITWEFAKSCAHKYTDKDDDRDDERSVQKGYVNSRISRDGGKKWLVIKNNELPEDLKEIWNYMIKRYGKNSCGRPNVNYAESKNKGYVILDTQKIPDCKICHFVEVEQERENHEHREHGSCQKNKEHKKDIKFICGEIKKKHHHEHDDDDRDDRDDDRDEDHRHSEHDRH